MEIHGIDMFQGAYRVSFQAGGGTIRGLVPETLVSEALKRAGRPEHVDVYQWIAAHRTEIESALLKMSRGKGDVRPPYDRLSLMQET